jgi:AcrR family transcriptional regulator
MSIPVGEPWPVTEPDREWSQLDNAAKRERLLSAAGRLFARDGLAAPMPAVAAEGGAGVASLYRRFASKRELLAALVIRRMEQFEAAAKSATAGPGDPFSALTELLWTMVERASADDFLGEARTLVADHPGVVEASERAEAATERLLAEARAAGRLRADATVLDIHLLFAATRAAKQVEPAAWRRTLELFIDALAR